MKRKEYGTGVDMISFTKPGASAPCHVMGAQAAQAALKDAGLEYSLMQQACVGYVYGHSTCGRATQRQVENARIALQHNLGRSGACTVTMYGME
jgi:hypothetical protein